MPLKYKTSVIFVKMSRKISDYFREPGTSPQLPASSVSPSRTTDLRTSRKRAASPGKLSSPSRASSSVPKTTISVPTLGGDTPGGSSKVNVGGSSQLKWFNELATHPKLVGARQNLIKKISNRVKVGDLGCEHVTGFVKTTRPTLDKSFQELCKQLCPSLPERFLPYQISLLETGDLVPNGAPPPYPEELRLVTHKRVKSANEGNEKQATWVISHTCHDSMCVFPDHLTWEPSWFNRLRDNCPGGNACIHRPKPCLRAHRVVSDLINWTLGWRDNV